MIEVVKMFNWIKLKHIGIKTQLFVVIMICAIVPLMIISLVCYFKFKDTLEQNVQHQLDLNTNNVMVTLAQKFDNELKTLAAWSQLPYIKNAALNSDELRQTLIALNEIYPEFNDISVVDRQGLILASTHDKAGKFIDISQWRSNIASGAPYIGLPEKTDSDNLSSLLMIHPIQFTYDDKQISGALLVKRDWQDIELWLSKIKMFDQLQGNHLELVLRDNQQGEILYSSTSQSKAHDEFNTIQKLVDILVYNQVDKMNKHINVLSYYGKDYLVASSDTAHFANIGISQWTLLAMIEAKYMFKPIVNLSRTILIISIMLAGLVVLLSFMLSSSISDPIVRLAKKMLYLGKLAKSGLWISNMELMSSNELKVLARSKEIVQLTDAFITMSQYMREQKTAAQSYLDELINNQLNLESIVEERTNELVCAVEEAERANRLKSQFLSNISHELRTPMHAILSFSDIGIKKSGKWGQANEINNLKQIQKSGERLLRLLNNLLDLSKLESGVEQYTFTEVKLIDYIESAVSTLSVLLDKHKLHVNLVEEEKDIIVECDAEKIVQVLTNVLANAIKFTPEYKQIRITLARTILDDEYGNTLSAVSVTVTDQGEGIPDDELKLIFDKFVQSKKTNAGSGGTGLGLAICSEIINAHSGIMWANNSEQDGAMFTFIIPTKQKKQTVEVMARSC